MPDGDDSVVSPFLRIFCEPCGAPENLPVCPPDRRRAEHRQFPGNLTAKMFGFKEYPFFQAPPEAKQVPKVNFRPS